MNGKIIIKGLKARAVIGVNEDERINPQTITLDIVIKKDLSISAGSDDINDTVDYDVLSTKVNEFVSSSSFFLIEKLAAQTALYIKELAAASEVELKIKKPGALKNADYAAVSITV